MMMKKVKKATPELATSKTILSAQPSRVGPRIDTELKNQGYNGPLTIIGIGNLEGVPHDFLKALSSGGVVIKQLPLGSDMMSCVRRALFSRETSFLTSLVNDAHNCPSMPIYWKMSFACFLIVAPLTIFCSC
ncbi:hypothetical protein HID58_063733 [Brassica napus]|uniref:Uncharacterized protein n=1 Tax=Brassica napus TaxID=3708 RepID=A0ABQ7XF01_BRANA|nr:hypothetical protein HID58_063733 [Brassica napus]